MKKAVKVAISLSDDLLHRVDRARRQAKLSRSEYFRQAAESLLDERGERQLERYQQGYLRQPETPEEVEAARAASVVLATEPWD